MIEQKRAKVFEIERVAAALLFGSAEQLHAQLGIAMGAVASLIERIPAEQRTPVESAHLAQYGQISAIHYRKAELLESVQAAESEAELAAIEISF